MQDLLFQLRRAAQAMPWLSPLFGVVGEVVALVAESEARLLRRLDRLEDREWPPGPPGPSPLFVPISVTGSATLFTAPRRPDGIFHSRWIFRADEAGGGPGHALWACEFDVLWAAGTPTLLRGPLWHSIVGTGPGGQPPAGWEADVTTTSGGLLAVVAAPAGQTLLWNLERQDGP